jgi:hypothetical protein
MKNKLLIALSLSVVSYTASSSILLDVPLAKKCFVIYQELLKIEEIQIYDKCKNELRSAASSTESAVLSISEDDFFESQQLISAAIKSLRHAQVYSCMHEEAIASAERKLIEIKHQVS